MLSRTVVAKRATRCRCRPSILAGTFRPTLTTLHSQSMRAKRLSMTNTPQWRLARIRLRLYGKHKVQLRTPTMCPKTYRLFDHNLV